MSPNGQSALAAFIQLSEPVLPSVQLEAVLVIHFKTWVLLLLEEVAITGDQHIDLGSHKAAERVLR